MIVKALITILLCGVWIWVISGTDFGAGFFSCFMFAFAEYFRTPSSDFGQFIGSTFTLILFIITVIVSIIMWSNE